MALLLFYVDEMVVFATSTQKSRGLLYRSDSLGKVFSKPLQDSRLKEIQTSCKIFCFPCGKLLPRSRATDATSRHLGRPILPEGGFVVCGTLISNTQVKLTLETQLLEKQNNAVRLL